MRIWIFQTGEPLHIDDDFSRPMRAMNLADKLLASGHDVTIWSSSFSHQKKSHRSKIFKNIQQIERLEYKLVPSPGYSDNIGLARLYDHAKLALNLARLLKLQTHPLPDVIFIGYPPIEAAFMLASWAKKNKIPYIIDVKDQWPKIFLDKSPKILRPLAYLFLFHYFYIAKRVIREADVVSSISIPFLSWSQKFSGRKNCSQDIVAALTVKRNKPSIAQLQKATKSLADKGLYLQEERPRFSFVGSISHSFNFSPVVEVARLFKDKGYSAQFVICGEGSCKTELQNIVKDLDNVILPGQISVAEIEVLFSKSLASIAPYQNSDDFKQSIPNKVIDSLAHGLPLLTSLEGEVKSMVTKHNAGYFYNDVNTLFRHCCSVMSNQDKLIDMKKSAFYCYSKYFDFDHTYDKLCDVLETLGKQNER